MVAASPSLHSVFVYGTLLADEVVQALLKRLPASSPAKLSRYQRFSVKGRLYPAILPVEGKEVEGKVLQGITDPELDFLDSYEDVEYTRITAEISLIDNSEKLLAYTYIWKNKDDPDLCGDWDFKVFEQEHMEDYLAKVEEYIKDMGSKSRVEAFKKEMQQPGQNAS